MTFIKIIMKINVLRLNNAIKAMGLHFLGSLLVALTVAVIVFGVWFPHPYRQLAGGTELFYLIMGVDIVCGPLLTLVLFNPAKLRRELFTDLSIVIVLQLAALTYGIWTVYQARPLYFVLEVDRFKVIGLTNLGTVEQASQELAILPEALRLQLFKGPQTVGLRDASKEEREKVMFESVQGGRDYGERPGFYVAYDGAQAVKAYAKAKPLENFAKKHPSKQADIDKLQTQAGADAKLLRYLPIIARQDWVAVLNPQGAIVGYVQGDGF
jgi:hypothetical protein